MIGEFEPVYRFLDLPPEADAAAVRAVVASRSAAIEVQERNAGSKPERMMAAKALREITERKPDVDRLISVLESLAEWQEARTACAEQVKTGADAARNAINDRKSAAANRGIAKVRTAAEKTDAVAKKLAGLAAQIDLASTREATQAARKLADDLLDATAALEAELIDSGLVKDAAFESAVAQVETRLGALEESIQTGAKAGSQIPVAIGANVDAVRREIAALSGAGRPRDAASTERMDGLSSRLKAVAALLDSWQAEQGASAKIDRIRAARDRLEKAWETGTTTAARTDQLKAGLAEIDATLADKIFAPGAAPQNHAASLAVERDKLSALRDRLRVAAEKRGLVDELDRIEKEIEAGRISENLAGSLTAVDTAATTLAATDLTARVSKARERIRLLGERQQLAAQVQSLEAAATARSFGDDFGPRLTQAEIDAKKTAAAELTKRLAKVRALFDNNQAKPPPPPPPPPPDPNDIQLTVPSVRPPPTDPVAADRFTLVGKKGERCHVLSLDQITFGRSPTNDVVVKAHQPTNTKEEMRVTKAMSRTHFTIVREGPEAVLADGGPVSDGAWKASANGTFEAGSKPISRTPLFRTNLAGFSITQEPTPANVPRWEIQLQTKLKLPSALAALREALPPGPDAVFLRRTDGLQEDVLIIWGAADLKACGITSKAAYLLRHKGGFLLWQDARLATLETGFRLGDRFTATRLGSLEYKA